MLKKSASVPRIRLPSGYFFKCIPLHFYDGRPDSIDIALFRKTKSSRKIGHVRLVYEGNNTYETHSNLSTSYRNKGLGAIMYAKAIAWCLERGYKVKSSGASSTQAQRVWRGKKLKRLFNIRVSKCKYDPDPMNDTWRASLKRKVNAKSNRRSPSKRKTSGLRTLR